ncbi:MAG: histidinol-phosphatase HisJ family protein [Candidatus Electrothrix sp. AR4]|nr:histidinol-phosphatase HisJ family protein [Candidatus Electrothrix sp. AR4]
MPEFPTLDVTGDHHIHTHWCNHADGEMEEYVAAAISRGLRAVTFLEHLECGLHYDHRIWLTVELFREYFQEGRRLQRKYADQITIRLGVEIGYNPEAVKELLAMLDSFPFEHRGLSCHFYCDGKEHLNMLSRRPEHIHKLGIIGTERVLDAYFNNLIRGCVDIPCDKLCHLDAALRHNSGIYFSDYHNELIEQLFRIMLEKNIALEVNTSGYELRPQPYPTLELIERAQELGISLILGSDAHQPEQVGRFFDRLARK